MRTELYHAETLRIVAEQQARLDDARRVLASGRSLSALEQGGVLHALQVLVENAIGKAKRQLKAHGHPVPTSAYDAFASLVTHGLLDAAALPQWNAVIGLRNRLVHDYMNVDMAQVLALVAARQEQRVLDFLQTPGH
ncbi:MAG: type VII toxin-antitoxin system HepT family RNase toxin [Rhodoferax sp.]